MRRRLPLNTVRDVHFPREGPCHIVEGPPGESHTGGRGSSEENVGQNPVRVTTLSC